MILLLISFIAGVLTVLAPCVLPLLPVIVGGSIDGTLDKKKAVIVSASLGVSVVLFTLLLKVSTVFIDIPPEIWGYISGVIIIIFGIVTLFPTLWEKIKFVGKLNRKSNKILGLGFQKKSVWGDIIIGASLGPVFASCSPTYFIILATVLPVSLALGTLYLMVYALGLSLALLFIALIGQRVAVKLDIAANPYGWFKRTLGVIFLIVGVAIFFGYDKIIEAYILSHAGVLDITQVEQKLLELNK